MRESLKYRMAIHQAGTRDEVMTAVRGYFAALSADETEALPGPLRAVSQWGVEEVLSAGMLLADAAEIASAHDSDAGVLREVSSVITLAALRMSILAMDEKRAQSAGTPS